MRRLLLPLLAAIAGGLLLIALPLHHPARFWGFVFDRQGAIARAREFANTQGVDADNWGALVSAEYRTKLDYYRQLHPDDPVNKRISAAYVNVVLSSPDKKRAFEVQIYPDGRVAGWEQKRQQSNDSSAPYLAMFDAKAVAQRAFLTLAGDAAPDYHLATEGSGTKTGSRFTWERQRPGAELQPTIDVVVNKRMVVHAETQLEFSKNFTRMYSQRDAATDWLQLAYGVLYFVTLIAAAVFYTLGSVQRKVFHRFAIAAALFNFVFVALSFALGSKPDGFGIDEIMEGDKPVVGYSGMAIGLVSILIMMWVVAGAGLFISGRLAPKWWTLRLLLSRRALAKPVGLSLAAGTLWGVLLAGIPAGVSLLFPGAKWGQFDLSDFFGRSILSQGLAHPLHPTVTAFVGVALCFVLTRIRNVPVRWLVFIALGMLIFSTYYNQFMNVLSANLLESALMFGAIAVLFFRFDLLSVLIAETVKQMLYMAAILLMQPAAGLRHSAGTLIGTVVAAFAGGMLLLWKAPDFETTEEATTRPLAEGIRSARDELKSEFSVAQRAQREMLPAKPPNVPGFSIAAHCTPARDVGGDLYDFVSMTGDRLAIAVADVSGKGVPAALYMTLTKGLLAATTEDNLPLPRILEHLNTHLHEACARKMFVTMALGILDAKTRTFEYARAGHNPAVWRSRSLQATQLLNTRGVGLGIASGKTFAKTLAVQRLELNSGDALVLYSDGLTEAMNPELEQFGEQRLMKVVEECDGLDAAAMRDCILKDVTGFLAGNQPQDDLTLVVLRVE